MTSDLAVLLSMELEADTPPQAASGVLSARVDDDRLAAATHQLATAHGARLADLFATEADDREITLRIVYALDSEGRYVVLECPVHGHLFPPLSDLDPAAFVEECEIYEQFGIRPANRKPLNRVHMAPNVQDAFTQLAPRQRERLTHDHAPHVVRGEAFEFPFGPVRAAGWESLYMGLVTTGEEVLDLYLFHWHKHRAVERRLIGLDLERALFLVERIDGLSAVGNALAFCRAAETAAAIEVDALAAHTRSIALELERIYNHAAAMAAMCQTTGLSVGQASAEIVLERLLRLNAAAFGHRYLFGVICPGGVRRAPDIDAIRRELPAACDDFRRVTSALLRTNSHVDRLEATGIVLSDEAQRLGLVGPVARGSGIDIDVRRDHPYAPYSQLPPAVLTGDAGDGLSRMQVMCAEVDEAERLIIAQLGDAGTGHASLEPRAGAGLGWAESVRGEALAWLALDADGVIRRARVRPASARNWRAFDEAARAQNVFTDIPIIEASFWLTVAGVAR
jgi:Ni,Fe-hydrogenase III large subunit/Ni,Fe-hydrogenase III component G